ncbi:HNH endonuclease [Streptomyces sp. NPDC060366]|uniref:HNH endonuclease n=1 Tax=Streptomyces sp. NPDC060366 TaxID=3347105 RepID=UPI0036572942
MSVIVCGEIAAVERPKLTPSQLKRYRKAKLWRRDGRRCFYCYRPFTRLLVGATIDHVVPRSLFRTNALAHVVLACQPCNHAKADRLPLSIALILCAYGARSRPTDRPTVSPVTLAGWLMLARLAAGRESAARSTPDLRDEQGHTPRHTRPDGPLSPTANGHESATTNPTGWGVAA